MDVRDATLVILTMGECYGNRVVAEIERRSDTTVNAGHVARTLQRLAASGLVEALEKDEGGRIPFALTDAGRQTASAVLEAPSADIEWLRFIATIPGVDVHRVIETTRRALDEAAGALPTAFGLAAVPKRGRPTRAS